jgi:molybdopterin molybdotransferase
MLSVADALRLVLEHAQPLPPEKMPLGPSAPGRCLAEAITADLDVPAFDMSMMDGYAVRAADLPQGQGTFTVIEEVSAGRVPSRPVGAGQATRIMTGATVPAGADVVIPIERTKLVGEGRSVEITDQPPRPGLNILTRGREMRKGEVILSPGTVVRPQTLGVLATCGRSIALLVPAPRVAITSTGDELIEPDQVPGPGQVRNSNAPMLLGQVAAAGGLPRSLAIARDTRESLRSVVEEGLATSDVLLLSGGVSAGKLDLVPEVLKDAGVVPHFHKIKLKPGKPLLFGTCDRPEGKRLVFGLPGNPVSSFVCFELFVRPALRRLGGHTAYLQNSVSATLTCRTG